MNKGNDGLGTLPHHEICDVTFSLLVLESKSQKVSGLNAGVDANSVTDPCCTGLALLGVVAARASRIMANMQSLTCE